MAYDKKETSSDYTQSPTQIEYNMKRQQKVLKFLKKSYKLNKQKQCVLIAGMR